METYCVMSPILHGGKTYEVGAEVELTATQAGYFGKCVKSLTDLAAEKQRSTGGDAGTAVFVARIAELETLAATLQERLDRSSVEIGDLNKQISDHVAVCEQQAAEIAELKDELAKAAKPAKGK